MNADLFEKRKFGRFPAKEGAMVGIVSSDRIRYTKLVPIVDVSKGGLSFESMESPDQHGRGGFLDILGIAEPRVHIEMVPFRMTYKREADLAGAVRMNRCGLQFSELSANQLSQLDHFLQIYAYCSMDSPQ